MKVYNQGSACRVGGQRSFSEGESSSWGLEDELEISKQLCRVGLMKAYHSKHWKQYVKSPCGLLLVWWALGIKRSGLIKNRILEGERMTWSYNRNHNQVLDRPCIEDPAHFRFSGEPLKDFKQEYYQVI